MSIQDTYKVHKDELDDIENWCETTYQQRFAKYFEVVKRLYDRFQSNSYPITDLELEEILVIVPLNLFSIAEDATKIKSQMEVIGLRIKQKKYDAMKNSEETSQVAKKEEAAASVVEDEILLSAYNTLLDRVDREISFSRELIMSAKKIWSSRKATETIGIGAENANIDSSNGINDLPDYRRDF